MGFVFGKRLEPDDGTPLVQTVWLLDRRRSEPFADALELGAVHLRGRFASWCLFCHWGCVRRAGRRLAVGLRARLREQSRFCLDEDAAVDQAFEL